MTGRWRRSTLVVKNMIRSTHTGANIGWIFLLHTTQLFLPFLWKPLYSVVSFAEFLWQHSLVTEPTRLELATIGSSSLQVFSGEVFNLRGIGKIITLYCLNHCCFSFYQQRPLQPSSFVYSLIRLPSLSHRGWYQYIASVPPLLFYPRLCQCL